MARISVVTGSASGIGKATSELLRSRGERVIGVDLHEAEVKVDLSTPDGRLALVEEVAECSGGSIDAVYAIAGVRGEVPTTVAVNFFGMVATLEGLRPLLSASAPRSVAVASAASLLPYDDALVGAMTDLDEAAALARAELLSDDPNSNIYNSTKRAFAQWIRRNAPKPEWAGASIPLNAVAPGFVVTPMTAHVVATAAGRARARKKMPAPLNGMAEPIVVARLLAWLGSEENTHLCGQVIFVDGGVDVLFRGDSTW